ncbi:MAG: bifunctional 2-polyprenyl-6-hydroxyphenol methylase/3-demethylubiquinol 3-O-methyltransferase UbiG [Alphaproteobacteria bacterium]|nr:bifunctional 2-polyprenyl-6-hydroxyphenol methylase/3-demethylubiquinol 3-O-methyltransferase UbiG [Alphaproteobacteria bacterium]
MCSSSGTVSDAEVARFSSFASEWWDKKGKMGVLHKFNPVRLAYIREQVCQHFRRDPHAVCPLEGLRLLDIGCGGGLLCEPMSRLGAAVVGVDPSAKNIEAARSHAAPELKIVYHCSTAEERLVAGERFDIVLNMEVVEHVADVPLFLNSCAAMLRPGGMMVVATLNRTLKAFILAILGAEYILGWLPRGCHDWNKFITPQELMLFLSDCGLESGHLTGVVYHAFADEWHLNEDSGVNYMLTARRAF